VPALYLAAFALSNLVIAVNLRRWFGRFITPILPPAVEARRRWRETMPLGANIVVLRVLQNIDLVLLGILAAPSVAGNYAAASRLIFPLVVAVEVLWAALLPRLSRLAHADPPAFRRSFNLYLGGVLVVLVPVAVGGALVGGDVMRLVYGDEFPDAGPVFRVLAVSYSLLAAGSFLGNTLVAADRQRAYLPPLVAGAAIALGGTLVLAPRLGAEGASWAMLAAHTTLCLLLVIVNRRRFGGDLGRLFATAVAAAAVMAILVRAQGAWPVLARIAGGATVYVALVGWPASRFIRRLRPAAGPSSGPPR
jgi:O-antigen/teichoic acid export membrane protein